MKKIFKRICVGMIIYTLLFSTADLGVINITQTADAHSGRTDSSGGHKDNKNKSGLGSYHYHCGGNPPHLHDNGVCPYSTSDNTDDINVTKSLIKEVQNELNDLGYKCGKADGIAGTKTKTAIKQYQEDYGLDVTGKINKETLDSIGIDY